MPGQEHHFDDLEKEDIIYRNLLASCPGIIFLMDLRGKLLFLGGAVERLIGFRPDDFRGKPFLDLVHEKDRERLEWLPPPNRNLDVLRTIELDIRTTDDKSKPFMLTYVYVNASSLGFRESHLLPEVSNINALCGMAMGLESQRLQRRILEGNIQKLKKDRAITDMLCKKLIDRLENERLYMARDLCDNLAESLGALRLEFDDLMRRFSIRLGTSELEKIRHDLTLKMAKFMSDVKEKAHGLMPKALETLGLEAALRILVEQVTRTTGIKVDFFSAGIPVDFPTNKCLVLYRIAETALKEFANKRSATRAFINLITEQEKIVLTYEDDSSLPETFQDPDEEMQLEIFLIKARVAYAGGELFVDDYSRSGLFFSAEIPK